jgi:hypothetical protein
VRPEGKYISQSLVEFDVPTAVMRGFFFWDITPCSSLKVETDVSEEHTAFIFRVEEHSKQKSSTEEAARKAWLTLQR